jgi:hypothetical protein
MWDCGGTCSGSSSEQVVTSISPEWRSDWKVNSPGFTVNHATNGAALARRQIEQWQAVACVGLASAS